MEWQHRHMHASDAGDPFVGISSPNSARRYHSAGLFLCIKLLPYIVDKIVFIAILTLTLFEGFCINNYIHH